MRDLDSRYDKYLASNEVVLYACRHHAVVLAKAVLVGLGGLLLAIFIAIAGDGLAIWIFLLDDLYVGWEVAKWWFDEYVITNKRIIKLEGIFARKVSTIPMRKITDTAYLRSLAGRILGYGDMVFDTPGQDKHPPPVLHKVGNPDQIYQTIMSTALSGGKAAAGPRDPNRERHSHWRIEEPAAVTEEIPVVIEEEDEVDA